MPNLTETMARRAVERTVADRQQSYVGEIQRIVGATYDLIERTGDVDPSLRDVLREAGLSTQAFYRYFTSKDELLLLILDDGRRRLLGYLEHQVGRASTPEDRLRAWVAGVLAQAAQPEAAARTRPFVAHQDRLVERFPVEQQASVDLLIDQLGALLDDVRGGECEIDRGTSRRDAEAAYRLVFATLQAHLVRRTRPTEDEAAHLVQFIVRGVRPVATRNARRSPTAKEPTRRAPGKRDRERP